MLTWFEYSTKVAHADAECITTAFACPGALAASKSIGFKEIQFPVLCPDFISLKFTGR